MPDLANSGMKWDCDCFALTKFNSTVVQLFSQRWLRDTERTKRILRLTRSPQVATLGAQTAVYSLSSLVFILSLSETWSSVTVVLDLFIGWNVSECFNLKNTNKSETSDCASHDSSTVDFDLSERNCQLNLKCFYRKCLTSGRKRKHESLNVSFHQ